MKKISSIFLCLSLGTILFAQDAKNYRVGERKSITAKKRSNLTNSIDPHVSFPDTIRLMDSFISNVQFQGDPVQFGYFTEGEHSIQIDEGFMLSTGNVASAIGPNESLKTTTEFNTNITDPDLDKLPTGAEYFDAAILEFDIYANCSQLEIDYVFASEEYCEYVNSLYTDILGIFISGPGLLDTFSNNAINAATVPDTTLHISAEMINYTKNRPYYVSNNPFIIDPDCTAGELFVSKPYKNFIEFDGFTKPLKAVAKTIVGATYHVKIALADTNDKKWDSAGFFKIKNSAEVITNCCPDTLNSMNALYQRNYQALEVLQSVATIKKDTSISFTAGNAIQLNSGFHAEAGAIFSASIAPCQLPSNGLEESQDRTVTSIELDFTSPLTNTTLTLYPNPARSLAKIEYSLIENQAISLLIFDLNGRLIKVLEESNFKQKGIHNFELNLQGLQSGNYFVSMKGEREILFKKLVVL